MKKINIACICGIIWGLIGIALNIIAMCLNFSPIFNLVLLIVNSILIGVILGMLLLSNTIVKYRCNFDRKEDTING